MSCWAAKVVPRLYFSLFLTLRSAVLRYSARMEPNSLLALSPTQLRRAAEIKERMDALNSEIASLLGGDVSLNPQPLPPKGGRRQMSAAGRARIAAAARARWAKIRKSGGPAPKSSPEAGRRTMSAAGRAKIAAAARARWAKAKAAGKSRL